MQHLKNFNWKKFLLQGVLPCLLAVAVGFISRYQLELSDGVTESFLQLQWPLYAPLNALTAFCLTLILFALLGKWSRATGISGAVFTIIALINYYTRDLHGSALMPQDILNLGTAAEVMGSYTLKITQDVVKIALLYLPILAIAFVQAQLAKGAPKRASWKARGVRAAGSALGVFLVMFFGYFGPVTIKPKTTYGWAWQNTYYTYGYLAGTIEATSLMADPVIEPENYNDAAAVNTARKADDYIAPASPESAEDYPDIVLILSESFYDFDLVTDLQADTDIMPVTKNLPNSVYGHTISPHVGGGTNSTEYEMLTSNSLILMPSITPFNWLNLYNANSVVSYLKGLGYSTMAAHPYTNSNYRRDSAWLALGFDETHFQSDFTTKETYGDRPYQTDSATYRDWETMYEAMPEDKPRFSFLVSIQSHGDYDMNDVVVTYKSTVYKNVLSNRATKVVDRFTLAHVGGTLPCGFGYQFDKLDKAAIGSVEVISDKTGATSSFMQGQMLEPNQSKPNVILFDNSRTNEGATFTVTTQFAYPVVGDLVQPPYNPYIVISSDKGRGRELHLAKGVPTDLADAAYFGQSSDISDPAQKLYYVSKDNFPFAINIPTDAFSYPDEKVRIDKAYPSFPGWVSSNGVLQRDWYKKPAKK